MAALANSNAFYAAQNDEIGALFEDDAWSRLLPLLDSALEDPFLPRMYRAEYHAIAAAIIEDLLNAQRHIVLAKEAIEDMVQVLEAEDRDAEFINARLGPVVRDMVRVAEESCIEEDVEDDTASTSKYRMPSGEARQTISSAKET